MVGMPREKRSCASEHDDSECWMALTSFCALSGPHLGRHAISCTRWGAARETSDAKELSRSREASSCSMAFTEKELTLSAAEKWYIAAVCRWGHALSGHSACTPLATSAVSRGQLHRHALEVPSDSWRSVGVAVDGRKETMRGMTSPDRSSNTSIPSTSRRDCIMRATSSVVTPPHCALIPSSSAASASTQSKGAGMGRAREAGGWGGIKEAEARSE
jgi:hypothetical protein